MNKCWLNKKNNENLIVFFNGWGMNDNVVSHLNFENYDVFALCDYRNFDFKDVDFSKYNNKYLISWSMGVYVCNLFFDELKDFDSFIAINGTQKPVDDNFGIPEKIYNLTINNFNDLTCKKFMKKISASSDMQKFCSRSNQDLKQELISIKNLKIEKYLNFDKVYISKNDKIFPYKNQINYWEGQNTKIVELEGMHYIFDNYSRWSDFL